MECIRLDSSLQQLITDRIKVKTVADTQLVDEVDEVSTDSARGLQCAKKIDSNCLLSFWGLHWCIW